MNIRRFAALGLSWLLSAGALTLVYQLVQAAPAAAVRFVATNGAGSTCAQANPCQLQQALSLAVAGDVIYVKQGTYTGSGAAVITVSQSITLFGGWSGNPTGSIVRNPATFPTAINAEGHRRGMFVSAGIAPTIDGFVIKNGNATGLINTCSEVSPGGCGGGIFVDRAAAHILHNQFISNSALVSNTNLVYGAGGGLYLEAASGAVISANVFLSNSASLPYTLTMGLGGGLSAAGYHPGSLIIQNNTFQANTGFWGGGLALDSVITAQVQGNLFLNNRANAEGAGLYGWSTSAVLISGNTFRGNFGDTPAFFGFFSGSFSANVVVDNLTSYGMIIGPNNTPGPVFVYNNIIAHSGGVGIYADATSSDPNSVLVLNNTLVGSGFGTGLLVASGYVTLTAHNTLISGFAIGASNTQPISSTLNLYYTLFDTNVALFGNATFSNIFQGPASFVDPANRNYHIGFNSAARDHGGASIVPTDIDGDPRPLGAAYDIGADETRFLQGQFLPLLSR